MSSANPFRASQLYTQSPVLQTNLSNSNVSVARRGDNEQHVPQDSAHPPPKTKKQVRIVSPTTSFPPHPDTLDAYESPAETFASPASQTQQHAGLPAQTASVGASKHYPFARDTVAQEAFSEHNMRASDISSSSASNSNDRQTALPPSSAPANPFSRTLASLEPQERRSGEVPSSAIAINSGTSKTSLDVESFKNLLMTGNPALQPSLQPPQAVTPSSTLNQSQFESSSSTDVSSISRQSLFEPLSEVHAESPRTSLEIVELEEYGSMGLVAEVQKGKKKPPPAPKHRHGKLVTPRQPQTVSFENFTAVDPSSAPDMRPKETSESNKPLPPVPTSPPLHVSTQDISQHQPQSMQPQREPFAPSEAPASQKRAPPPVPLARRQSQLRTSTDANRSRSNSSLTMSSQHSIEPSENPVTGSNDALSGAKPPPPPPRSRHGARLASASTSSVNSSSTEITHRSGSTVTATSTQGQRSSLGGTEQSEPPSPVLDIRRTSSISSNRTSQRVTSDESTTSANVPPPPPPPRRRQSHRSSLDSQRPGVPSSSPMDSRRASTEHRRTSAENRRTSLDSKRRTSVASESSLRREYAPADERSLGDNVLHSPNEESENNLGLSGGLEQTRSDSTNILDDMEKFQREIDELRNRYKQAGKNTT